MNIQTQHKMTTETTRKFIKPDKHGNVLMAIYAFDAKNKPTAITVKIRVRGETRERTIGLYDMESKIFHVRRQTEKHLFRKNRSFGFNWDILNDNLFKDMRFVRLFVDENYMYDIPLEAIKQYGKPLMFKQQGFELQLFVPLEIINNYLKN